MWSCSDESTFRLPKAAAASSNSLEYEAAAFSADGIFACHTFFPQPENRAGELGQSPARLLHDNQLFILFPHLTLRRIEVKNDVSYGIVHQTIVVIAASKVRHLRRQVFNKLPFVIVGEKMIKNLKTKFVMTMAAMAVISTLALAQNPQISLRSTDGRAVNSADLKGKIIVLSFGGTWVPLASKELPALQKLADRYSTRGVQVYWVSINSDKQGTRNYAGDADLVVFAQKNNVRLTILRDPEQQAYKAFGLDAVPTVVILDRDGKVVRKHVGFGTEQGEGYGEIIRELDQLLK